MKSYNVCIVGGGSTYTLGFLKSFVRLREEFPLKKLVLFDIDAERQEPIGKYGEILFRERFPELDFSYTTDIKEAYEGMDFVFMQMRAGGLPMRAKDEHIPLSMGMIGQETCGAGGMAYGLRSCVDMIKAVHDIRNYAPDAWILNYSNPAAIVAEALRREFPDDKRILNICDQPENVVRSCSRLLGCNWEDLDPVYFGLNHYGWFTHIYDAHTGEDLLPKIRETIAKNGFLPQDAEQRDQSWLDTYGMVQTIMSDFPDYLPNTYDQYYLYPDYKVQHLNPNFTRADEVMAGREKRVFSECAEVIKEGKLGDRFHAISDAHAEMMIKVLPEIAGKIAEPLSQIDKITIIGGGSEDNGIGSVAGNVPVVMAKLFESMKEATGVDLSEIMRADTYDAKVNRNIQISSPEELKEYLKAEAGKAAADAESPEKAEASEPVQKDGSEQ